MFRKNEIKDFPVRGKCEHIPTSPSSLGSNETRTTLNRGRTSNFYETLKGQSSKWLTPKTFQIHWIWVKFRKEKKDRTQTSADLTLTAGLSHTGRLRPKNPNKWSLNLPASGVPSSVWQRAFTAGIWQQSLRGGVCNGDVDEMPGITETGFKWCGLRGTKKWYRESMIFLFYFEKILKINLSVACVIFFKVDFF